MSASATASGNPVTVSFSGENGGSTFVDFGGYCFTRVNPTFSQKEWGAKSDGSTNDTTFLQSWIDANQPHIAVAGNSIIQSPLTCGAASDIGIIQGAPVQAVAEDPGYIPPFQITANNSGHGLDTHAMLIMAATLVDGVTPVRCAIHGVGLIGDGTGAYDIVLAQGKSDLIDGHSYLSGGCYNVNTQSPGANLEIYDSSLNNSYSDNASIGSPNVKLVRNSFAGAGTGIGSGNCYGGSGPAPNGNNITFTGSDVVISDNIIQQARGWGIRANGARLMRITGNYFDNNGKGVSGTGAIDILNSGGLAIAGNTFHRSGAATQAVNPPPYTSHVYFEGRDDSVSLSGNVYYPGMTSADTGTNIRPDYVYDADKNAVLTNITVADNQAPQNRNTGGALPGLLSPNAAALLSASIAPQYSKSYLTGLTLSNNSGPSEKVDIAAGEAVDSTGTTILRNSGCTVNLASTSAGLENLDVTGGAANNTTYYFFIVSAANGAQPNLLNTTVKQSCMASASLTPSFANVPSYSFAAQGFATNNSPVIFDVGQSAFGTNENNVLNPLAGMAVGDLVTGTGIPPNTTILSLTSYFQSATTTAASTSSTVFNLSSIPLNLAPHMLISGTTIGSAKITFPDGTLITSVCFASGSCAPGSTLSSCPTGPYPCVVLSNPPSAVSGCSCTVNFTGNFTATLSNPVSLSSQALTSFTVYHGLYRLVGALYTDSSGNVVQFTQDGDTFYLANPVKDIGTLLPCSSITTTASTCRLSVPCGRGVATCGTQAVAVEALGRLATGGPSPQVLISSLDQSDVLPSSFTTAPGNTSTSSLTADAYPFRIYTSTNPANTSGAVRLRASTGSTTVNEVTDGWLFHRAQ